MQFTSGQALCLSFILSIRISRIEGNVDIRQRNLYNIYVFGITGEMVASLPFFVLDRKV